MIHPPGTQGVLAPDGTHLCHSCAAAAGIGPKKDASRTGIVPAERRRQPTRAVQLPPQPQAPTARAGTAATHGRTSTSAETAAPVIAAPAKPAASSILVPAVIGAFGVVVFLIGLLVFFTTRNTQPPANLPPIAVNPKIIPPPPKPETPVGIPLKRDPEPEAKTPELPAKVVAPTPAKVEPLPVANTPPVATPPKIEPAKPPAKVDDLPAFTNDLAAAAKLSAEEKFGAALDLLAKLKTTHAQAPWFAAQRDKLSQTEKRVQEQLSEYSAEAEEARSQATKAATPEALDKIEKAWKARAAGGSAPDGWALLDVVSTQSESGATFTKVEGGSLLLQGSNPQFETYTVVVQTALSGITAFRLDVLPHGSLPGGGPGRNGNGNFVLSEFSVQAAPISGGPNKPVQLVKATADYSQPDHPWLIEHTLDGDKRTGWAIGNTFGIPHTAVYETAAPLSETSGLRLTFTLDFRTEHANHVLGHFRLSATTARTPQSGAAAFNVAPVAPEAAGDPLAAGPARGVLKAVGDVRAKFAEQARQKRLVDIAAKLDTLERTLKMRPSKLEPVYKALEELEALVALDPAAIEKFAPRLGVARFDASIARDGDLSVYKTTVKSGAGAEVLYHFATSDEFTAWAFDSPDANAGSVELDTKKSQILVKTVNRRNWDGRDRRNMPLLRVPFYFAPDHWLIEADVELVSDGNKGAKPDFGIMVWDGGSGVARFSVTDGGPKGIHAMLAISNPKRENFWSRPNYVNGKVKDLVRLQMGCAGGTLTCSAISKTGGTVTIGKEALGFEPKHAGIFLRTSDDGENAAAAFHSFRMQGVPHLEHLKEWHDAQSKNASANEKGMLERRAATAQVLSEGLFVPLDLSKAATFCCAKRMFLNVNDEERIILPNWGLLNAGGVPFMVADPKGETVNNIILLPSPQGPACASLPRSVVLPCGSSASAIHLLGCASGWGWNGNPAEKGSLTALIKLTYENGMVEEHRLLNGVHISDYIRQIDVPESKLAFKVGERQVRYLTLRTLRPNVPIKNIEFIKGDDKTAPYFMAVTLDRRANLPAELSSRTDAKLLASGKIGNALVCTGNSFVEFPHADDLEPQQLTIESWVFIDEYAPPGDTRRWLINKNGNEGNNGHYALLLHDEKPFAYLNIGGQFQAEANTRLALKQWQHVAMTYDGVTLKVFLNGVECGATAVNRARTPWDRSLVIGRRQDGPFAFTGLLDEVRIYNRALPADELKSHVTDPANASKDGLLRHWNFD
jgi:hypothetical protein